MLDVAYKKLNKKPTGNKSEEIYLKEFDSIRNVRPEYVIFPDGKRFKNETHTHLKRKEIWEHGQRALDKQKSEDQ